MELFIACKYIERYLHATEKTPFAEYFTFCCQILHFSSLKKKKSPILIREQIYSLTGTAFVSTRKKKKCVIAQFWFGF